MIDVQSYRAWNEAARRDVVLPRVREYGEKLLDAFVSFAKATEPQAFDRICDALQEHVLAYAASLLEGEEVAADGADGLSARLRNVVYGLVSVAAEDWICETPVSVLQTELTLATYIPRYLLLKALVDVLGREPGKERMRQFLDQQIDNLPKPTSPPQSLAEMREQDIPWNQGDGGQNAVSALVSEHQCLKKVTACRIQHVLAPLGDPDLMDVIACYPDFASIRRTNQHFVLTRTQNLILGGAYCDTCFHDTRGGSAVSHPPKEVFDHLDSNEGRMDG